MLHPYPKSPIRPTRGVSAQKKWRNEILLAINEELEKELDDGLKEHQSEAGEHISETIASIALEAQAQRAAALGRYELLRDFLKLSLPQWTLQYIDLRKPTRGRPRKARVFDVVDMAVADVIRIRKILKREYGGRYKPTGNQLSAEDIAVSRWKNETDKNGAPIATVDAIIARMKPSGAHRPKK